MFQVLGVVRQVFVSRAVTCPRGTFRKADMLIWDDGGSVAAGQAKLFVMVELLGGAPPVHLAFVDKSAHISAALWSATNRALSLVWVSAIKKAVPFQRCGDTLRLLLPVVLS